LSYAPWRFRVLVLREGFRLLRMVILQVDYWSRKNSEGKVFY